MTLNKEIVPRLLKWVCPFCTGVWWEKDDVEGHFNSCVYCGKDFDKEYSENE